MGVSNFARALATRYNGANGGRLIRYYELWNEPDSKAYWKPCQNGATPAACNDKDPINADEYLGYIKDASDGLKRGNPDAEILLGGLAYPTRKEWLDDLLEKRGGQYFKYMNIHVYPANICSNGNARNECIRNPEWILRAALDTVRSVMQRHGDIKPIWITETSIVGGSYDVNQALETEEEKARFLPKIYAYALSQPDVEKVFWHTLRNPAPTSDGQYNFGLGLNPEENNAPFNAYWSLKAFTERLLDSTPSFKCGISLGVGEFCHKFTKGPQDIYLVWTANPQGMHVNVPTQFPNTQLRDTLGRVQATGVSQVNAYSIGYDPVYITINH